MTSARFSMRLDSELKDWLEGEAKRKDRSAGYIAVQAIRSLRQAREHKREIIRQAMADADKGVFISEEKMDAWVMSWDSENELPEPAPDVFPDGKK